MQDNSVYRREGYQGSIKDHIRRVIQKKVIRDARQ